MTEYEKIIYHYGEKHQIRKLAEEQYELCEALYDRYLHEQDKNDSWAWAEHSIVLDGHIEEEIADNLVLIRQFIEKYQLNYPRIEDIVLSKIERQLLRIEKGE